jgi:hypothetical protein
MKKRKVKTGEESLHPLGDKLEEILDVMDDVRKSLDTWRIGDCDISSPCFEYDDDTGAVEIVTLIGQYDFRYTVEEFVNNTFGALECGSSDFAKALITFRRKFDESVLKTFEKYKKRSDPEEVNWATEQIADYNKELDGRI